MAVRWCESKETLKPYFQKLTGIDNIENSYLPSERSFEWSKSHQSWISKTEFYPMNSCLRPNPVNETMDAVLRSDQGQQDSMLAMILTSPPHLSQDSSDKCQLKIGNESKEPAYTRHTLSRNIKLQDLSFRKYFLDK